MSATFQASTYDALDPGVYPATLIAIETGSNDFGGFRKWKFRVQTAGGEQELSAMTSDASGPRSKAYAWATALLGHKPTGEPEELDGKTCQLVLIVNDDGYNRIDSVLPPAKAESGTNLERLDDKVYGQSVAF